MQRMRGYVRFLALALAVIMLINIPLLSVTANALEAPAALETSEPTNSDVDMLSLEQDDEKTNWAEITDFTEGSTYYIGSETDLLALANLVNTGKTGKGSSFLLTCDVDLSSICGASIGNWTPIGSSAESCFEGTFDGGNYSVTGLYISTDVGTGGLFGYTNEAEFKNIVLYGNIETANTKSAAAFVYNATNTTIRNCTNYVNVSGRWASGIVVNCSGTCTITNCTNNGTITCTSTSTGQAAGILCSTSAKGDILTVTNCENNGKITGLVAAGITGSQVKSGNVEKCTNTGAITSTKSAATGISDSSVNVRNCTNTGTITCVKAAAGIIGIAQKGGEITGCVNKGEIITTSAANGYTAGIAGKIRGTMNECVNLGSIQGSYYVGGLAGTIFGDANILNSYNRGSITEGIGVSGSIGGLIGSADNSVTMTCCYNTGNINTPSLSNVGGLIGNFSKKGTVVITDCYHSGTITGNDAVGGFVGNINHASATLTIANCYSAADSVTAANGGVAGSGIGKIENCSSFNASNLFVRKGAADATIGSDVLSSDQNTFIQLTHAQMADASFVTHLGTAFAKFSTDIYNGQEYSESDWATYTEYYGDYAYPILVSTCGASPLGERCNVQFLGAQYAKVTVNGDETYATTVTPGTKVRFTIETGDPEITVTSVAVGDSTLEATDGTYSYTVSADTIVTITLSGTMTAPSDGSDTPEKTSYPVSFAVSDGTNPIDGVQITVTGGEDASFTPEEGIFWLDEGTYTVAASLDGYHSVKGTMTVTSDMSKEETNTISFNLYPTSVQERTITMNIVAASTLDSMMVYNGDLLVEQKDAADSVSFTLPAGSYVYSATKADSGFGSGPFTIADADGQTLTLRAVDMTTYGLSNSGGVGYTVTMKAADGTEYFPGSLDAKKGGGARGWFLLPASDYGEEYHYTFNPISDYYWGSYGVTYLYSGYVGTALRDFNGISGSQSDTGKFVIAPKATATFTVPTGATLKVCHRVKFYEPLEVLTPSNTNVGDGVTTYTYDIPSGVTLHYELEMAGYVKKAATFTGSQSISITTADLTPASSAATDIDADIDSAILTNAPSSHYIELDVGERFDLYLHRNWQATNSITGNYYVDPTYHIEVISGSSVSVTDNYYAGATLNAVSDGVSVIRITYDALDFVNSSGESYIYSKLYEENTTVLVVNVGGNGVGTIDSGCGASEFEIQYFIRSINDQVKAEKDQYAELTFTPSTNVVSVEIHDPVGSTGTWSDTWTSLQKSDNSFVAHLKEGSNILRFTTADGVTSYHVIRAIGLDMTVTGDTVQVKLKNGQFTLEANTNDELTLQFKGLQMPLPKLAALINPGLESVQNGSGWGLAESTYATYTLSGNNTESTTITGKSSQYEISTKNALTLNLATPDTYTLTEGALHTTSFGAGSYTGMTRGGYTGTQPSYRADKNTSLDTRQNLYSTMPDLKIRIISVDDQTAVKAVEDLIDAIGTVTLHSKAAIEAAEAAYEELTEEQKTLVGNCETLVAAREAYNKLLEEPSNPSDGEGSSGDSSSSGGSSTVRPNKNHSHRDDVSTDTSLDDSDSSASNSRSDSSNTDDSEPIGDDDNSNPYTGDEMRPMLLLTLLAASGVALVFTGFHLKKRRAAK